MIRGVRGYHQQCLPITYLGVPLITGKVKSVLFDGFLAKIRGRISYWSSKLLTARGKLILLRHVLSSMPVYLLQVLKPPMRFLQFVKRLFDGFLWDANVESRRIHWSSWEKICFLIEEGGLNFISLEDMIDSFSL